MKASLKTLLIGPRPPPHGGISVHVAGIYRQLSADGVACAILDTSRIRSRLRFAWELARYAARGWTLHLHTNGHNRNSWLLALLCGLAGRLGGGSNLTLHSGMMPAYVRAGGARRVLAGLACRLYSRIDCVGPELRDAVVSLGIPIERTSTAPAFLAIGNSNAALEPRLLTWIAAHSPIFSTSLSFRPEYGFDVLIQALRVRRGKDPSMGCIVMGSGEQAEQAALRVREAGLENHVLLLGDVDHEVCLAVIARSDVFVRPTLVDGDSISVREALALGIPVVASRIGSRPAGTLLFHPGDRDDLLQMLDQACATEACSQQQSRGAA